MHLSKPFLSATKGRPVRGPASACALTKKTCWALRRLAFHEIMPP